jgi:polyhydroxybutyrate depolymerase
MFFRMTGLITLLFAHTLLETASASNGKSTYHEMVVDGIQRSYIMYSPTTHSQKPLPLMIVLHGGLGNAEHIMKTTAMNDIADSGPFVVAYPNGVGGLFGFAKRRTWNAGGCCGPAVKKGVDDVKFVEKIIGDIGKKISIDTRRIYVTGMSNGAMMAYRLAAAMPDKIAAVIAVAGTMAIDDFDAAKSVAVMLIHGSDDKNVPIGGGSGAMSVSGVAHRSLADTVSLITRARHCSAPEMKTDKGGVRITSYRCSAGAPVVVVLIEEGSHAWPGGHGRWQPNSSGHHFSASKEAWEFAKQFSKTSK